MRRRKGNDQKRRNNVKKLFEQKSYGFYLTLVLIAASLVCGVIYTVLYGSSIYMSWPTTICTISGAVLALALAFTPYAKWSCAVLALADFIGLLTYIYGIYFYISIVLVGIQASTFNFQFKFCTAAFVILLVLNIVNVFLKQTKEGAM